MMKWVLITIMVAALAIVVCASAQAETPAPGQGYLYVGNTGDDTVTIISMQNDSKVSTIDTGTQVTGMAADPTGYYVYLMGPEGVKIIDTQDDNIRNVGMGAGPHAIVAIPDGSGYYVLYGTYINMVKIGSGDIVQKITIPRSKDVMSISADGKMACLGSNYFETVGLYGMPAGDSESPEIDFGKSVDCTFSPDGEYAYISLMELKKVIALKAHDYFIKYDIPVNSIPAGLAVSPDGSTLYITQPSDNKVVAVNTSSRSIVGTIDVGTSPQQIVFSPDGSKAYVTNAGSNSVSVINTGGLPGSIGSVVKTISVGNHPSFITIASKPSVPTPIPSVTPTPTAIPSATPMPPTPTPVITPPPATPTPTPKPTPGFELLTGLSCLVIIGALANKKIGR
jgi:YVTN family beta-propeller protein